MADDFGMTDGVSPGILHNMNGDELGVLTDDNFGQGDIANIPGPNAMGFGSLQTPPASLWTHSSFPGPSNTRADCQEQVPRYIGYSGADSTTLNIGSDDDSTYNVFRICDFISSNTVEVPTMATSQAFPPVSGQASGFFDREPGSASFHHAISTSPTTRDIDQGALKKRKTSMIMELKEPAHNPRVFDGASVLKLVFKLNQDPTITQMEHIAEETGYSVEYVFQWGLQYRSAVKSSIRLPSSTISTDGLFAFAEQSISGIHADLANGKKTEDSTVGNVPSEDTRQEDVQREEPLECLEHTYPEKIFRCAVEDCKMRFSRQGDLKRHSKKHLPGEHPCTFPSCDKVFYRKDKLQQHWEKKHGKSSQPPSLSSCRPRKDHDQDDNSGSNGSSGSEGYGPDVQSFGQCWKGKSSDNSASSRNVGASNDYNMSSRNVLLDCQTELYSEIDVDSKIDVIGEKIKDDAESKTDNGNKIEVDSTIKLRSMQRLTKPDQQAAGKPFQKAQTVGMLNRNDYQCESDRLEIILEESSMVPRRQSYGVSTSPLSMHHRHSNIAWSTVNVPSVHLIQLVQNEADEGDWALQLEGNTANMQSFSLPSSGFLDDISRLSYNSLSTRDHSVLSGVAQASLLPTPEQRTTQEFRRIKPMPSNSPANALRNIDRETISKMSTAKGCRRRPLGMEGKEAAALMRREGACVTCVISNLKVRWKRIP